MSDTSAAEALRSSARLVVIEAPAGCGKTFQGSEYAREVASLVGSGRVLILTHTHAACDVFAARTARISSRVDIRTIDSLIVEIASAYHRPLALPVDSTAWARSRGDGFPALASKVAALLRAAPMIARAVGQRYPVVICDEHQDASADQESVVMSLLGAGVLVRVFGDPLQQIFRGRGGAQAVTDTQRWEALKAAAGRCEELTEPHRWANGASELGQWILAARASLRAGGQVDLRPPLPVGLTILFADNQSPRRQGGFGLAPAQSRPIYELIRATNSMLVLSAHNATVEAVRAFLGRSVPIWEGHVRESLTDLVGSLEQCGGDATRVAEATVAFLGQVTTGFSRSAFGDRFIQEVNEGCTARCTGKPATLQALGRMICDEPSHKGVGRVLERLNHLRREERAFEEIKIDYPSEYWDGVRLSRFDDAATGLAEISHRLTMARPLPPAKAVSTIHKAKGLETSNVLILPCDRQHFGGGLSARCLLYVGMSRATRSLTLVVSRQNASPLFLT